jgi:hypothetical protein
MPEPEPEREGGSSARRVDSTVLSAASEDDKPKSDGAAKRVAANTTGVVVVGCCRHCAATHARDRQVLAGRLGRARRKLRGRSVSTLALDWTLPRLPPSSLVIVRAAARRGGYWAAPEEMRA